MVSAKLRMLEDAFALTRHTPLDGEIRVRVMKAGSNVIVEEATSSHDLGMRKIVHLVFGLVLCQQSLLLIRHLMAKSITYTLGHSE